MPHDFLHSERLAYFSMEIALRNEIHTYSGGLGILAGDTVRSAADLELPMVTVSLVNRAGYFRQEIDREGRQQEYPDTWEPSQWAQPLAARVAVPIDGHQVWVGGWLYVLEGHLGGRQPVILLDTELSENSPSDREITQCLHGGDEVYRLKQEIVLGIGGVRMLGALGFKVRQYHMNEGHSALLTLQLLNQTAYPSKDVRSGESRYDVMRVRELCNFTTHTPIEAGHDKFAYELVDHVLGNFVDPATLRQLAGADCLNMTRLALNLSEYVNGVARRHAETSRRMFPGYQVHAITNGVHPHTWTSASFARLYDSHLPGWCHEPGILVRAGCCIPDERDSSGSCLRSLRQERRGRVPPARECGLPLRKLFPRFAPARRRSERRCGTSRTRRSTHRSPRPARAGNRPTRKARRPVGRAVVARRRALASKPDAFRAVIALPIC